MAVDMCRAPDVWNMIQLESKKTTPAEPLYRTTSSSSLLSSKSLQVCTESLGSETGSDIFFDETDYFTSSSSSSSSSFSSDISDVSEEEEVEEDMSSSNSSSTDAKVKLLTVNYHCSINKKTPARSFPPPLPSISRRDGPCLSMRTHRRDGRLVVEAVPVPSQNYLHVQRHGGRLLLSFIHSSSSDQSQQQSKDQKEDKDCPATADAEEEEEEEEEEEGQVEVVDRGTVVEVKMNAQPHRSSFVFNKFVGGPPESHEAPPPPPPTTTTTTTLPCLITTNCYTDEEDSSSSSSYWCYNNQNGGGGGGGGGGGARVLSAQTVPENKMLFMSKSRRRGELLHRCSHLWRPLFIWEPYCIATSS